MSYDRPLSRTGTTDRYKKGNERSNNNNNIISTTATTDNNIKNDSITSDLTNSIISSNDINFPALVTNISPYINSVSEYKKELIKIKIEKAKNKEILGNQTTINSNKSKSNKIVSGYNSPETKVNIPLYSNSENNSSKITNKPINNPLSLGKSPRNSRYKDTSNSDNSDTERLNSLVYYPSNDEETNSYYAAKFSPARPTKSGKNKRNSNSPTSKIFDHAVEKMASVKLSKYLNEQNKKSINKNSLITEIQGYQNENINENRIIAAWKIRFFIEFIRFKIAKRGEIQANQLLKMGGNSGSYSNQESSQNNLNSKYVYPSSLNNADVNSMANSIVRANNDIAAAANAELEKACRECIISIAQLKNEIDVVKKENYNLSVENTNLLKENTKNKMELEEKEIEVKANRERRQSRLINTPIIDLSKSKSLSNEQELAFKNTINELQIQIAEAEQSLVLQEQKTEKLRIVQNELIEKAINETENKYIQKEKEYILKYDELKANDEINKKLEYIEREKHRKEMEITKQSCQQLIMNQNKLQQEIDQARLDTLKYNELSIKFKSKLTENEHLTKELQSRPITVPDNNDILLTPLKQASLIKNCKEKEVIIKQIQDDIKKWKLRYYIENLRYKMSYKANNEKENDIKELNKLKSDINNLNQILFNDNLNNNGINNIELDNIKKEIISSKILNDENINLKNQNLKIEKACMDCVFTMSQLKEKLDNIEKDSAANYNEIKNSSDSIIEDLNNEILSLKNYIDNSNKNNIDLSNSLKKWKIKYYIENLRFKELKRFKVKSITDTEYILNELNNSKSQYNNEIESTRNACKDVIMNMSKLQYELTICKQDIEDKNVSINHCNKIYQVKDNEIERLNIEITNLKEQNNSLNNDIKSLNDSNSDLQFNFNNMETFLTKKSNDNQVLIDNQNDNIIELNEKITIITDEKNNVQLYLTDLVIKLQNSLNITENLTKIKITDDILINELNNNINNNKNDINILTCNNKTSNDIINNLNYKIEGLIVERENLAMGTEDLDEILRQNIQTLINTGGYCRYLEEQLFASRKSGGNANVMGREKFIERQNLSRNSINSYENSDNTEVNSKRGRKMSKLNKNKNNRDSRNIISNNGMDFTNDSDIDDRSISRPYIGDEDTSVSSIHSLHASNEYGDMQELNDSNKRKNESNKIISMLSSIEERLTSPVRINKNVEYKDSLEKILIVLERRLKIATDEINQFKHLLISHKNDVYIMDGKIKKIQFDDAAAWMQGFQEQHGRMPLEDEFYADSQHRFNAIEEMIIEVQKKLQDMINIIKKITDKKEYIAILDMKITNIGNSILILLKDENSVIDMDIFQNYLNENEPQSFATFSDVDGFSLITTNSQHETPLDGMSPPQTANAPNVIINTLVENQNLINISLRGFNISVMDIDFGDYLEDDDDNEDANDNNFYDRVSTAEANHIYNKSMINTPNHTKPPTPLGSNVATPNKTLSAGKKNRSVTPTSPNRNKVTSANGKIKKRTPTLPSNEVNNMANSNNVIIKLEQDRIQKEEDDKLEEIRIAEQLIIESKRFEDEKIRIENEAKMKQEEDIKIEQKRIEDAEKQRLLDIENERIEEEKRLLKFEEVKRIEKIRMEEEKRIKIKSEQEKKEKEERQAKENALIAEIKRLENEALIEKKRLEDKAIEAAAELAAEKARIAEILRLEELARIEKKRAEDEFIAQTKLEIATLKKKELENHNREMNNLRLLIENTKKELEIIKDVVNTKKAEFSTSSSKLLKIKQLLRIWSNSFKDKNGYTPSDKDKQDSEPKALYDDLYRCDKEVEIISKEFKKLINDYSNLKLKYEEYCNTLTEMEVKFDSDITQMQDGKKAIIKFESIPDTAVELATELNQVDKEIDVNEEKTKLLEDKLKELELNLRNLKKIQETNTIKAKTWIDEFKNKNGTNPTLKDRSEDPVTDALFKSVISIKESIISKSEEWISCKKQLDEVITVLTKHQGQRASICIQQSMLLK